MCSSGCPGPHRWTSSPYTRRPRVMFGTMRSEPPVQRAVWSADPAQPDGTVVTDLARASRPATQIRAKEIDVELARETFLDPRDGRIPLAGWVQVSFRDCSGEAADW